MSQVHRPRADLVFNMDNDAMVDWRRALPLWFTAALGTAAPSARAVREGRLYLGRLCPQTACPDMPLADGCAAGLAMGLSAGVVSWIVNHSRAVLPRIVEVRFGRDRAEIGMALIIEAARSPRAAELCMGCE